MGKQTFAQPAIQQCSRTAGSSIAVFSGRKPQKHTPNKYHTGMLCLWPTQLPTHKGDSETLRYRKLANTPQKLRHFEKKLKSVFRIKFYGLKGPPTRNLGVCVCDDSGVEHLGAQTPRGGGGSGVLGGHWRRGLRQTRHIGHKSWAPPGAAKCSRVERMGKCPILATRLKNPGRPWRLGQELRAERPHADLVWKEQKVRQAHRSPSWKGALGRHPRMNVRR